MAHSALKVADSCPGRPQHNLASYFPKKDYHSQGRIKRLRGPGQIRVRGALINYERRKQLKSFWTGRRPVDIDMGAEVWGSNHGLVKSGTVSPTARHRCYVSSELCCPGAKPRRWGGWGPTLVARFGVITRVYRRFDLILNFIDVTINRKFCKIYQLRFGLCLKRC